MLEEVNLKDKEKKAIEVIRKGEKLSKMIGSKQYVLGFSGGKDSTVLYHLTKRAGVKFTAKFYNTTICSPSTYKFIKSFNDVLIVNSKDNFWRASERFGFPSPIVRWCCSYYKEAMDSESVVLLGLRSAESIRRRNRTLIELFGKSSKDRRPINGFDVVQNDCIRGSDKILINPLINWAEKDILSYASNHKVKLNDDYNKGFKRVGCLFCPLSTCGDRINVLVNYPRFVVRWLSCASRLMSKGMYKEFDKIESLFAWYLSGLSKCAYLDGQRVGKYDVDWISKEFINNFC